MLQVQNYGSSLKTLQYFITAKVSFCIYENLIYPMKHITFKNYEVTDGQTHESTYGRKEGGGGQIYMYRSFHGAVN